MSLYKGGGYNMIRYSDEAWAELQFTSFQYLVEKRDNQWVDVVLQVETAEETPLPLDVMEFSIVAICTHQGHPIQLVTMEEGCDSEYQLTAAEKEQINAFIRTEDVKQAILHAAAVET
jgi:acyl-CoA synthetase (NDP forming)